jgi:hypothetical protein
VTPSQTSLVAVSVQIGERKRARESRERARVTVRERESRAESREQREVIAQLLTDDGDRGWGGNGASLVPAVGGRGMPGGADAWSGSLALVVSGKLARNCFRPMLLCREK